MKKLIALTLSLVLLCTLLTGCMGMVGEVTLNEDATGTIKVSLGYTEEGLELMSSAEGEGEPISTEGMTAFTYNGNTYYGEVQEAQFASLQELNEMLQSTEESAGETGDDSDVTIFVEQNKDGSFVLTVTVEALSTESINDEPADPETEELMNRLLEQMTVAYEFTFPTAVTQIEGPTQGVTIDKNLLILDTIAMKTDTGKITCVFTNSKDAVKPSVITFDDVDQPAWYYDAVMALAEGGLVAGMGNNLFAPEGSLTYAQFCQILARAKGLPTGAANDYWAYNAIESCLDAGYIQDRGPVTAENFDAVIPREAAVSAMYLAKKETLTVNGIVTASDIPDYASVSDVYKENVLAAYNCGITSGMDELKTFNPQGTLTRAQVCQLFYNLKWTSAN
ncbi:MAG: S-layer homology domain-containing protein [Clostridia bacterium]|nr:S-layer homology domain-containing protein [Clostridia bacterium]